MPSILTSAVWVYGRVIFIQLLNLVTIAILARLLDPKAFGVVALTLIIFSFSKVFVINGVNQFVIYDRSEGYKERQNSAFWLAVLVGIIVMIVGMLLAHPIAVWYEEPYLKIVLSVLLIGLPFEAALGISDAIINKVLRFKEVEIRDSILFTIASSIAIMLALLGYGLWALILPNLLILPIRLFFSFKISKWIPKLHILWEDVRKIIKYTVHIIGSSITTFFISEGDSLLVGKILGLTTLGIYNIAWRSSNLIIRIFVNTANRLIFPWLNNSAEDMNRFIHAINRVLSTFSFFIFPLLWLMIVVAEDFIYIVYGPKWDAAVLPLQILIIYAIRYSIGAPVGLSFKVLGRPDIIFKIVFITLPFYIASIIIGSRWGIIGVALAVTIVRTSFGMLNFLFLARLCKTQIITFFKPILKPLIISFLMATIVGNISFIYEVNQSVDRLIRLILTVCFGFISYSVLMRIFYPTLLMEMYELIERTLGKKVIIFKKILMLNTK